MTTLLSTLQTITGAGWLTLELVLLLRDRARGKGGTDRDRGTRALNFGLIIGALVVANILPSVIGRHSPLLITAPAGWPVVVGLLIAWLGLAIRVWAVVTLGRSFRTTVEVDTGQAVVTRGPYRWVRHPSYSGILLLAVGLGLALRTWPGLAVCLVLPVMALVYRIRVEEAVLTRVIGDPYRAYQNRTKRLVPGLW